MDEIRGYKPEIKKAIDSLALAVNDIHELIILIQKHDLRVSMNLVSHYIALMNLKRFLETGDFDAYKTEPPSSNVILGYPTFAYREMGYDKVEETLRSALKMTGTVADLYCFYGQPDKKTSEASE